jgi:hypothetical protein
MVESPWLQTGNTVHGPIAINAPKTIRTRAITITDLDLVSLPLGSAIPLSPFTKLVIAGSQTEHDLGFGLIRLQNHKVEPAIFKAHPFHVSTLLIIVIRERHRQDPDPI